MKAHIPQSVKYIFVGLITVVFEYISFYTLYLYVLQIQTDNEKILLSQILSFIVALIINFLGNRYIAFRRDDYKNGQYKQIAIFFSLAIFNLFISTCLIFILVSIAMVHPVIAKLITIPIIIGWNFIVYRTVIFK